MVGHGVEVALRSEIAVAPPPSKYHKHGEQIEPVAAAYADRYAIVRGWPVSPDGLEAFIVNDLGISFVWEDGDDAHCEFYARYDPSHRVIIFNSQFDWIRDERPDLYISFLTHEIGHVILRHGEALDVVTASLFDDDGKIHFLNHPKFKPREMEDELVKKALLLVGGDARIAVVLRKEVIQDRFEPDWMYDQAQHFVGGFIVPRRRLLDAVGDGRQLQSWDGIHQLASQFRCSNSLMEVRLKKLGLILVEGGRVRPTASSGIFAIP